MRGWANPSEPPLSLPLPCDPAHSVLEKQPWAPTSALESLLPPQAGAWGEHRKTALRSVLESLFKWNHVIVLLETCRKSWWERMICTWNIFTSMWIKRPHVDYNHDLGILGILQPWGLKGRSPHAQVTCFLESFYWASLNWEGIWFASLAVSSRSHHNYSLVRCH